MHALGFEESEAYATIAGYGLGIVYAGPGCFEWLIANQLLNEVIDQKAVDGDLVMYFSRGRWTHVGRLTGQDRAVSKWGVGLLYEHELSEIPAQYGDEVRFFRNPGYNAAMDLFESYAAARRIRFGEESR